MSGGPTVSELEKRIAVVRQNIAGLVEQAAAFSGGEDEAVARSQASSAGIGCRRSGRRNDRCGYWAACRSCGVGGGDAVQQPCLTIPETMLATADKVIQY
jgi:hypothetical protein